MNESTFPPHALLCLKQVLPGLPTFPRFYSAKINFPRPRIADLPTALHASLLAAGIDRIVRPGKRIAIAVGSRGITNLPRLVALLGDELRSRGALPFVVPAMGSHGQGTAQGQKELLEALGILPRHIKMEVVSSLEVTCLGQTAQRVPVYIDRCALDADGIIVINRVHEHSDFDGPIQSGLMKMLAVGLGKAAGASAVHACGAAEMHLHIPAVARYILQNAPVLLGIGLVENAYDELAALQVAPPDQFEPVDRELLSLAKVLTPRLPVDSLDVLVVGALGKEISGIGMDTKTVGRRRIPGVPEPPSPRIERIVVLDLTRASHGNATGLYLADITTRRLAAKIDYEAFYLNQLAAGHLEGAKIPLVLPSDLDALQVACQLGWRIPPDKLRVAIIKNTKSLSQILISEALLPELLKLDRVSLDPAGIDLQFSPTDDLLSLPAEPSPV